MSGLTLEIVEGPGAGKQFRLDRVLVLGRAPDADIVLEDTRVSRHHARIRPANSAPTTAEDLDSTNGTFLNGSPLHGALPFDEGDELQLGVTVFVLRTPADVAAKPSVIRPVPPALAAPERRPTYVAGLAVDDDPDAVKQPDPTVPELERLRDSRAKLQARLAPLAVFVLVALVVAVYFGTR
jgi:hypothetical protein